MSGMIRMTEEQYAARQAKKVAAPVAPKKSKYGNKKVTVDGIEFDSLKEARRYQDLALMQQAKQIKDLRRQVPFKVSINNIMVCVWIADFTYTKVMQTSESPVVEDVKGFLTDVYRLKRKLVEAQYGIRILET